jgi:glycosyltransferase involved in cell wall biosynthesis
VSAAPLVSVVIPAYNAEQYICEAIDSALAQTYPSLEVLVVDDGSTDGTRERVRAYGDRVRYIWQDNSGLASSPRNHGLRVASGQIVAFLDADDTIDAGRVASAVRVMARHPEVALVFTNFQHFDGGGVDPVDHFATCPSLSGLLAMRPDPGGALVLSPEVSTDLLLTENFGSSASIVRHDVLSAVAGYDETLKGSEDFEWHYRIAARYPIAVIPEVLSRKRRHEANITSDVPRMLQTLILTRKRLLAQGGTAQRRRKLRRMLGGYYLALAYHYTGRHNRRALRYAIAAMRFTYRPSLRHFARIVADRAGRDTHGKSRARAIRLDANTSSLSGSDVS